MIEEILNKVYTSELLSSEELHILTEWICDKDKEIDRLNNIINELEKYIIDFREDYEENDFQRNAKVYIYWKDLIDKIKELKGSDKE